MQMTDPLTDTISMRDLLLLTKALPALAASAQQELIRIEQLSGLDQFSEADVREEIITPIVRALGYDKGSVFSVDREKKLDFGDKRQFIDYSMTLFRENFWLIEAKRPNLGKTEFTYTELWQAVQYSIHPEVNAALVVICDGHKLEVFDREASLAVPILHIDRQHLVRDFDQLRALLSPWQVWFFEKRRIVRLLNRVFDREFNLDRVEEFRTLVNRRLDSKRTMVLENLRAAVDFEKDSADNDERIRSADTAEIVNVIFFQSLSRRSLGVVAETLVKRCERNAFSILNMIFPDEPRDVNDAYFLSALYFLTRLAEHQPSVNWLPGWLSRGGPTHMLDEAIKKLIELSLTCFEADESRKVVLLFSAAVRRLLKIVLILAPNHKRFAELVHAVQRHFGDELNWNQIVSSPERHSLILLDSLQMSASVQFVREHMEENGRFRLHSARQKLIQIWSTERSLLESSPNYRKIVGERDIEALGITEASYVGYDQLGHCCLCVVEQSPKWKSYTLAEHRNEIEVLAAYGSWQARNWLGLSNDAELPRPNESAMAQRFFFGDVGILHALQRAYGLEEE